MKNLCLFVVSFLSVWSCAQASSETQSDVQGKIRIAAGAFKTLEDKPPHILVQIGKSLAEAGRSGQFKSGITTRGLNAGQERFTAAYVQALVEYEGIPRRQGVTIIRNILDEREGYCNGISCARVFGLKASEADDFLAETLARLATDQRLLQEKLAPTRKVLISSLLPAEGAERTTVRGAVDMIYAEAPGRIPTQVETPSKLLSRSDMLAKGDAGFVNSLQNYTMGDFESIRLAESSTDAALGSLGWTTTKVAHWRSRSRVLAQGIRKLPTSPGRTYRGIALIKSTDLARWYQKWRAKIPVGLGLNDAGATTSTSLSPKVASDFALDFGSSFGQSQYGVLYIIDHKSGVSIESVSAVPVEKEILLPHSSRFDIQSIAPAVDHSKLILIHLREVQAALRQEYSFKMAYKKNWGTPSSGCLTTQALTS